MDLLRSAFAISCGGSYFYHSGFKSSRLFILAWNPLVHARLSGDMVGFSTVGSLALSSLSQAVNSSRRSQSNCFEKDFFTMTARSITWAALGTCSLLAGCVSLIRVTDPRLIGAWNCQITQRDFQGEFRAYFEQEGVYYAAGAYKWRIPELERQYGMPGVSYTYKTKGQWSTQRNGILELRYNENSRLNVTVIPGVANDQLQDIRSTIDQFMDSIMPDKKLWRWNYHISDANTLTYAPENGTIPRVICTR